MQQAIKQATRVTEDEKGKVVLNNEKKGAALGMTLQLDN